jgi:hypothetical protein
VKPVRRHRLGLKYDSLGRAEIFDIVGEAMVAFMNSQNEEVQVPKSLAQKIRNLKIELRNLQGHPRTSSELTRSAQINKELGSLVASFDPDAVDAYADAAARLDQLARKKAQAELPDITKKGI